MFAADLRRHSAAAWSRIDTGTTKVGMSTNGYLVIAELGMEKASCWIGEVRNPRVTASAKSAMPRILAPEAEDDRDSDGEGNHRHGLVRAGGEAPPRGKHEQEPDPAEQDRRGDAHDPSRTDPDVEPRRASHTSSQSRWRIAVIVAPAVLWSIGQMADIGHMSDPYPSSDGYAWRHGRRSVGVRRKSLFVNP